MECGELDCSVVDDSSEIWASSHQAPTNLTSGNGGIFLWVFKRSTFKPQLNESNFTINNIRSYKCRILRDGRTTQGIGIEHGILESSARQ